MKYNVTVPYAVWVTVEVEADNREDAEEAGLSEAHITGFCGNGGFDKLIGVTSGSIEASDIPLEDGGFSIEVSEAE